MGVQVCADLHTVRLAPWLPDGWEAATLERLSFGGHTITVHATLTGLSLAHLPGSTPLTITYRAPNGSEQSALIQAGRSFQL